MKSLIKTSLAITKAIKWDTNIWLTQGTTLDFSKLTESDSVAVIYIEPSLSIKEGINAVICRIADLKSWIEGNRSSVKIHNHEITLNQEDIFSWKFAKFRELNVKFGEVEKPEYMEQIKPNGMKIRPVEIKSGVFKDYWFKDGKYYDVEWEFWYEGKRGKNKGVNYKAVEPMVFKEVKIDC